jgi:hypothetical protein
MPPKIARLAGLGAYGASAGLLALMALLFWGTRPPAEGGITPVLSAVTWISLAIVFAALIAVHVVLGRALLAVASGRRDEV